MGAIVARGLIPGGRARLWCLLPHARVGLLMYRGGAVLSAVRALHRCQPNAGHAKDAEDQHQKTSHRTSHSVSIAGPFLPRNQGFTKNKPQHAQVHAGQNRL